MSAKLPSIQVSIQIRPCMTFNTYSEKRGLARPNFFSLLKNLLETHPKVVKLTLFSWISVRPLTELITLSSCSSCTNMVSEGILCLGLKLFWLGAFKQLYWRAKSHQKSPLTLESLKVLSLAHFYFSYTSTIYLTVQAQYRTIDRIDRFCWLRSTFMSTVIDRSNLSVVPRY